MGCGVCEWGELLQNHKFFSLCEIFRKDILYRLTYPFTVTAVFFLAGKMRSLSEICTVIRISLFAYSMSFNSLLLKLPKINQLALQKSSIACSYCERVSLYNIHCILDID